MIKIIDIFSAASALKSGEVIVIPTETVYGIAADARNNAAVKRIYEIKGRPYTKPLQLMAYNLEQARKYLKFTDREENIAKSLLPGPLTMILEKKVNLLAKEINTINNTMGLRIPNHTTLLSLLELIDFPIVATSANISGGVDPTTVEEAINNLNDTALNYAVDGGKCLISKPSTVADFTNENEIRIIREGSVTIEELLSHK